MQGVGLVEVWVLLKNGLLFAVILSFCFLSCGDLLNFWCGVLGRENLLTLLCYF